MRFILVLLLMGPSAMATIVPRLETESEFSRKKHIRRAKVLKKTKEVKQKRAKGDDELGLEMPSLLFLKSDEKKPYANSIILSMDNDNFVAVDQLFGDASADDFGQTHAMYLKYLRYDKRTGSEWGVEFETGLYTKLLSVETNSDGSRTAIQNFREISTLAFVKKWPTTVFDYIKNRFEVGIVNETKPIWGLALYQQAGNSGESGFHSLIGIKTKLDNRDTGPQRMFGGIGIGYGRLYPISWDSDLLFNWNEIDVTLEGSFLARTIWEGSQASLLARANIPLIRVSSISVSDKFLSLNLQTRFLYFPKESTTGTSTTFGFQFQFTNFGLGINSTFPDGSQNPSFIRFDDKNTIHSLTLFGEI